jgi:hypothetical protein
MVFAIKPLIIWHLNFGITQEKLGFEELGGMWSAKTCNQRCYGANGCFGAWNKKPSLSSSSKYNNILVFGVVWKKKLLVFKENVSTFGLHFKFVLHVAIFFNMPSWIII